MANPQHTQDDPRAQGPAVPPQENLQLLYMRGILIGAGYVKWDGTAPPAEPFMDVREMLGRALWLVDAQDFGGGPESDYEDWLRGYGGEQLDELLDRLALVVTPPAANPN